jgi:hypothetical protein
MASISPPTPHNLNFSIPKFPSRRPFYPSPSHSFSLCRCHHHNSSSDNSVRWRWDSALHDVVSTALKRFDSYFNSTKKEPGVVRTAAEVKEEEEDDWDWDRWRKHFDAIDAQERLVSILKVYPSFNFFHPCGNAMKLFGFDYFFAFCCVEISSTLICFCFVATVTVGSCCVYRGL